MKPDIQWSYSGLSTYEKCAYRYYLGRVEKIGGDEPGPAARRGTKIHSQIEAYLNHQTNGLPKVVQSTFGEELERAREADANSELKFGLTREWKPTNFDDAWARGIIDMVIPDKSIVVDFKTGRYYPDHREQASFYALAAMSSELTEDAYVEFWYMDRRS